MCFFHSRSLDISFNSSIAFKSRIIQNYSAIYITITLTGTHCTRNNSHCSYLLQVLYIPITVISVRLYPNEKHREFSNNKISHTPQ